MGYPDKRPARAPMQATSQPDLAALVREAVAQELRPYLQSMERLQALAGERGREEAGLQAVTRGDLGALTLASTQVSAAPTAAEFNALLSDMREIARLLGRIGAKTNV